MELQVGIVGPEALPGGIAGREDSLLEVRCMTCLVARVERIMAALKIPEQGKTGEKAKAAGTKKGLQLDDNDIRKLKKIGVGMDES